MKCSPAQALSELLQKALKVAKQNVSYFSRFPWYKCHAHLPCPEECTVMEYHKVAAHCRVTARLVQLSQYKQYSTKLVFLLAIYQLLSGLLLSVRRTNKKCPVHMWPRGRVSHLLPPPTAAQLTGKMQEPVQGVPCHVKLRSSCRVCQSPSFSSAENLKSCNRGTLADFLKCASYNAYISKGSLL